MRDKEKVLEELKAQAIAEGTPLSDYVIELLETVLDMEDKAYNAGYMKGFNIGFDAGYEGGLYMGKEKKA
ncbi:hypothetical protein [Anaerotignum sp.]